ncbi:MAG TPA: PAS domain S-box protein [Chitinophagaceae bacterium]|nr:PAS domain S-box protein [Chitinophagaceae bacterium]
MQTESSEDKERLSSIIQSSQDAIISKEFDGTITSWNTAAERIFGYTAAEAIGQNISFLIPDELLPEEKDIIAKVKGGGVIEHYETIRKTKNGERISISLTVSGIKDGKGNIVGVSKIARDITFEKQAEEKQAILAAIVNSSDDAIISKTLDGIITSWNYAAQKMFGYTNAEAIGRHISLIIPPERIQEETVIINNIRSGNRIDHFDTVRVSKSGQKINISLTVSPVKNNSGKIIGASKIARDVTQRIEADRKQQLYTEKLQELNKYKDEFMAMASHELKTPVTVIKANLQIVQQLLQGNRNLDFINKTLKQIDKLSDFITNLLDISKIQVGKLQLNPSRFDLNILLKEITDNIQQTTSTHTIILAEAGKQLFAYADKDRLDQVIINLLTNAIKYSPNAKDIFVDACKNNGQIIVSIKDNGIGIPQEDIGNIFYRFYRVGGLAATFAGSGIGLYISAEIIKQHGGKIWAESKIGEGSVFYFSIPASE